MTQHVNTTTGRGAKPKVASDWKITHRPSSRDILQNNLRVAVKTSNDDNADDWDDDKKAKLSENWNNNHTAMAATGLCP